MDILVSFIALSVVVFIHELGHMVIAKWVGIEVMEFAVGMGPKLISKRIGETEYAFRLLPIGGFVKLAGMMDGMDDDVSESKRFINQGKTGRALTLIGGPLSNVIFGFLILTALFKFQGVPVFEPVIQSIVPNSPAEMYDFKSGDRLIRIDGQDITSAERARELISSDSDNLLLIQLERSNELLVKTVELTNQTGRQVLGVVFKVGAEFQPVSMIKSMQLGGVTTWRYIELMGNGIKQMIMGGVSLNELSGPVGIIQITSSSLDRGAGFFFSILAIISISLGIFNLMPIPLLDGGHLMFIGLEWLRGKKLSTKTEGIITRIAFAVLISLMIFSVSNDVINWQDRVELFENTSKELEGSPLNE